MGYGGTLSATRDFCFPAQASCSVSKTPRLHFRSGRAGDYLVQKADIERCGGACNIPVTGSISFGYVTLKPMPSDEIVPVTDIIVPIRFVKAFNLKCGYSG